MEYNLLERFLIFSSGTSMELLKKADEQSKNYAIAVGSLVVATAIMALFSGYYAIHSIFQNKIISVLIAIFWSFLIYNLDRFILVSFVKENLFHNFIQTLPRVILASIIAIVISKPIELRIFDKEIRSELISQTSNKIDSIEVKMTNLKNQEIINSEAIKIINEKIQKIDTLLTDYKKIRDDLFNQIKNLNSNLTSEVRGQSGSYRGDGPVARAIRTQITQKKGEIDTVKNKIEHLLTKRDTLQNNILIKKEEIETKYKHKKDSLTNELTKQIINYKNENYIISFFTKNKALSKIEKKEKSVWWSVIVISLLFFIIETVPVFSKLISKKNQYDYLILEKIYLYKKKSLLAIKYYKKEILEFDNQIERILNKKYTDLINAMQSNNFDDSKLETPVKELYHLYIYNLKKLLNTKTKKKIKVSEIIKPKHKLKYKINFEALFFSIAVLVIIYLILDYNGFDNNFINLYTAVMTVIIGLIAQKEEWISIKKIQDNEK